MLKLMILGRLVKDAKGSFSNNGTAIAKFTLAVNETKDKTTFHDVTAFGKVAEIILEHTKKGQMIFVDNATINNNKYEKDGEVRYTKDIIVNSFRFC